MASTTDITRRNKRATTNGGARCPAYGFGPFRNRLKKGKLNSPRYLERASACKYCVGLTHCDCENHVLFPTVYDYDFIRQWKSNRRHRAPMDREIFAVLQPALDEIGVRKPTPRQRLPQGSDAQSPNFYNRCNSPTF